MEAQQGNEAQVSMKVLQEIFEVTHHPCLNVYQLRVAWQGEGRQQDIFLHESMLFRGLEESLKIEDSYTDSSLEDSQASSEEQLASNVRNDRETYSAWRNETRP
jgi:hypothetical protein